MDFTRQPIIETVISPKEGHKLLIRNSKEANQEEYLVNAVEIVSFGSALFFRCLESKPKAFLLPIADYDIVEVKETRMVLKNVSTDKPIKIGDNKPPSKEGSPETSKEENKTESESKKSGRKRHSRKRRSSKSSEKSQEKEVNGSSESKATETEARKEMPRKVEENKHTIPATSSIVSVIFPPPPKIIGRKAPEESSEQTAKKVFPEAIEEPANKEEASQVASSKNLPKLDEIKEVSGQEEAVKASKSEAE